MTSWLLVVVFGILYNFFTDAHLNLLLVQSDQRLFISAWWLWTRSKFMWKEVKTSIGMLWDRSTPTSGCGFVQNKSHTVASSSVEDRYMGRDGHFRIPNPKNRFQFGTGSIFRIRIDHRTKLRMLNLCQLFLSLRNANLRVCATPTHAAHIAHVIIERHSSGLKHCRVFNNDLNHLV